MKLKRIKSILFVAILVVVATSCGQTKEEEERELKQEDSIANIQSDNAVERANALFETDSLKTDTLKK
jgi:PBP1b-binding outer membrane lipoprotein LpoB